MLLEVGVLYSVLPKDSTKPSTSLQIVLGYTQAPGAVAFRLIFGTGLGHQIDRLAPFLGMLVFACGFAVPVFLQLAVMGLPFWLALRFLDFWRAHSEMIQG